MPLFTRDNAREMARKANLVRWSRPEQPATAPDLPEPGAKDIAASTRAQILAIDSRLAKAASMDAETLDLLTRSKERLWKILAHAGGIAAPANFKPERKRRGETIDLEPVALELPALSDAVMEGNAVIDKVTPSHDNEPLPGGSQDQEEPEQPTIPGNGAAFDLDAALATLATNQPRRTAGA